MVLLRPALRVDSSYCPLCTSAGRRGWAWVRCECGLRVHHACVREFSVKACPTPGCRAWSRAFRGNWAAVSGARSAPVVPGWFVLAGPAVGLWLVVGLALRPGHLGRQPLLAQALLLAGPLLIWVLLASYLVVSMLLAAAWHALTAGFRRANGEPEPIRRELEEPERPFRPTPVQTVPMALTEPAAAGPLTEEPTCPEVDAEAERLLAEAGRTWYACGVRAYAGSAVRIEFRCRCCNEHRFAWVEGRELARATFEPSAAKGLVHDAIRSFVDPGDNVAENSVGWVAKRLLAETRPSQPRRPWRARSQQSATAVH